MPDLIYKERRPFHFLGTFGEKQKATLWAWTESRKANFARIEQFWRIRAQQLRKSAGVLEDFYATQRNGLKPFFVKDPFKPSEDGHFTAIAQDDAHPAQAIFEIKERFQPQLQLDDEGVFMMDHVRCLIEAAEDLAMMNHDAVAVVTARKSDVDQMFEESQYEAVLVKDISDLYKGQPKHRCNPLDAPTAFEKDLFAHTGLG